MVSFPFFLILTPKSPGISHKHIVVAVFGINRLVQGPLILLTVTVTQEQEK